MKNVAARAERIPFRDEYFDVVSSFVSLKHVTGIEDAIREIVRVTARGGIFLLITSIKNHTSKREPTKITWGVVEKFRQHMELARGYVKPDGTEDFRVWSPQDPPVDASRKYGLRAMFLKV